MKAYENLWHSQENNIKNLHIILNIYMWHLGTIWVVTELIGELSTKNL